jgi:spore germination protein
MNKNKIKNSIIILILLLIVAAIYFIVLNKDNKKVEDKKNNIEREETVDFGNLSAWVAYWDLDVNDEILALNKNLENLCYFAANFDEENNIYINDNILNFYNKTKNDNYNKYLTIVNDKVKKDGSSIQKDTKLLEEVLSSDDKIENHVKEVINLIKSNGFDGVEIDYEQIKNNAELWNKYMTFISELYNNCNEEELKLRVLLEPNIPFDDINFVEGPTYVMMCYSLHGGFSEPGEKANPKFIKDLIEKMKKVPGEKNFALATGGFDWSSEGKTKSITEIEARGKIVEYDTKVERDKESHALVFKYEDENKVNHEVWYADTITLSSWISIVKESGYDITLWRLGGNTF